MLNTSDCQTGFTWHNWGKNLTANPSCYCTPKSKEDLPGILQQAKNEGKSIRVLGGGFSWTAMVPTDGFMIDMTKLNKILSVDTVKQQVTVEAGLAVGQLSTALSGDQYKLSFATETVIPWITVGGAVALGCHGTGYSQGTVSDLVVAMEVLLADGTWRTFSAETDGEEMMDIVRVNLGALGIIYSVTLQCVPRFNLSAVDDGTQRMKDTIGDIKNLVTSHDYVEVFWFPFNENCWIKTWDKTDKPITENDPTWGWDEMKVYLEINSFGKRLMGWADKWPWLTPYVMKFISGLMPQQSVIAVSSLVFHYQLFYMPVWDMSYCINIPNNDFSLVQKAWMQVVKRIEEWKEQGKYPQNMVLHTRYIKNSSACLSPASGEDHTCCIEILTYTGNNRPVSDYQTYFQQVEQDWIELGGKPHWGKAIYSVDKLKSMYGQNMDAFLQVRQQLDPEQVFMNDFLRQVFQLPSAR